MKGFQRDHIEGDGARIPVLRFRQTYLSPVEIYLISAKTVLLAHAHFGAD